MQVGPGIAEASPRAMLDAAYYGITRHSLSGLTGDEELVARVGGGATRVDQDALPARTS